MLRFVVSVVFLCLFLPFSSTSGQVTQLYQINGAAGDSLGYSVAGVGDVNGDGKADFIVGAPAAGGVGSAYIYSGVTGVLLFQKNGAAADDNFGNSVAGTGDVNGDGKDDFIIGAPFADPGGLTNAGSTFVYSGATGLLLFQKDGAAADDRLSWSVAGAGDVNGDGKADFIIGAWAADPGGLPYAGSAFVYSGADGSLLFQKNGVAAGDLLGASVARAGDVNGDGKADFIVGAPFADPGGLSMAGSAFIYSGTDGSLLFQKDGSATGDAFGISTAGAGDINGDGKSDFIVGANFADPGGVGYAGSVFVYSGADGSLLFQKNGTAFFDNLGNSVAGAGDVNGDGKADFIVGAYRADGGGLVDAGSAFVYSGADGSLLFQINGVTANDNLGFSVAGVGDMNGNGRADVIVGARLADPGGLTDAGSAYVYSFSPTGVTKEEFAGIPSSFLLAQNFPNPFNAGTQIVFELPGAESRSVRLEVFDILGQRIATLIDQSLSGGRYHVTWDGKDGQGKAVGSGVYFYRLTAGEFKETRRMTLIK